MIGNRGILEVSPAVPASVSLASDSEQKVTGQASGWEPFGETESDSTSVFRSASVFLLYSKSRGLAGSRSLSVSQLPVGSRWPLVFRLIPGPA